ncbi:MAG: lipopolysaccharide biosynthesis protein [Flavipsychrobacter sp.]|jgi:O-antigen/teichoic acid export membrane protein
MNTEGSIKRNYTFIGNSIFLFLTRFFPTLATLLVMIYFSHYLSFDLYGDYNNFWVRLYLVSTVAALGIQNFLVTYSPSVVASLIKTLTRKHKLYYFGWVCLMGLMFTFLQNLAMIHQPSFSDAFSAYRYQFALLWLPFCFFIVYVLSIVVESVLMVFKNRVVLIWVNVAYSIAFGWVHYRFVQQETGALDTLFMYLLVLASAKLGVYSIAYYFDMKKQPISKVANVNRIRNLWAHMAFYDVSQMVFRWIDKFVLGLVLSAGLFAVYFNGSVDIPFLPLLLGAVGSSGLMQLSYDNREEAPLQIQNKTGRILSCIVFPAFFFFYLFRYEFIELTFSVQYLEAVPIFLMSILVLPLRAYKFTTILQHKHMGRIINIGAVLDIAIACGLAYPLYLKMGLSGIALSFVISTYIQSGYYLYHTAKVLKVSVIKLMPIVNWVIKFIVFGIVFIGFRYLLPAGYKKEIILISGIVFTLLVMLTAFLIELKAVKRIYGHSQAKV